MRLEGMRTDPMVINLNLDIKDILEVPDHGNGKEIRKRAMRYAEQQQMLQSRKKFKPCTIVVQDQGKQLV
eukprot:4000866-Heterocapsa_arctica.AAC.1